MTIGILPKPQLVVKNTQKETHLDPSQQSNMTTPRPILTASSSVRDDTTTNHNDTNDFSHENNENESFSVIQSKLIEKTPSNMKNMDNRLLFSPPEQHHHGQDGAQSPPPSSKTVKSLSLTLEEKLSLTPRPLRQRNMNANHREDRDPEQQRVQTPRARVLGHAPKSSSKLAQPALKSPDSPHEDSTQLHNQSFRLSFDAPQFHDFAAANNEVETEHVDDWFDTKGDDEASTHHVFRPRLSFLNDENPISSRTRSSIQGTKAAPTSTKTDIASKDKSKNVTSRLGKSNTTFATVKTDKTVGKHTHTETSAIRKNGTTGTAKTSSAPSSRLLTLTKSRAAKMASSSSKLASENALRKRYPKSPGNLSKKASVKKISTTTTKTAPTANKRTTGRLTVPKPFNLHTSSKTTKAALDCVVSDEQPQSPFVPLAVRVAKFQNATPVRFRRSAPKPDKPKSSALKLTHPQSPFLSTKLRSKPTNLVPKEVLEVQELEKMPKFKARPLNKKILVAEKPLGVPEPPKYELTVPMSPAITKPKPATQKPASPPRIIKANPIPDFDTMGKKTVPHVNKKPLTVPLDFKLPGEEISERKKQVFLETLKKEEIAAKEARQFKAHPLPPEEPDHLPRVEKPALTAPEPFHLATEIRGEMHSSHFQEKLQHEEEELHAKRHFKAHEIPSTVHDPFIPKRSDRPVTEPVPIMLHTDLRVEERKEFDEERRIREEMEEEQKRIMEEKQKEIEEQEIRQLRKKQIHKAQPIRKYAPTIIEQSRKKLTEPRSPMIGEKRRQAQAMQDRHSSGSTLSATSSRASSRSSESINDGASGAPPKFRK